LKNDKTVGIGAVDCDIDRNICAKHGVNGYPTIKAFVAGKGRSYNGAREAAPMKGFITQLAQNRGSKGGSAKCLPGMFKNKVKHAVVPLCEAHFPNDKAKNDWLVLFYDHSATAEMRDALNGVASDLGNDPPDMNKALKKQQKKRERIEGLVQKHGLKSKLPSKGPFGMEEITKVGAVCCDCDKDHEAFCANSLKQGEEDFKAPQAFWVSKGHMTMLKDLELSSKALTGFVLQKLGFAAEGEKAEL
jgi:hypothetical protein